ncbi:MAG: hypothetical protein AB7K68_14950 [Bacteriovoracia bacterium]
MTRYLFLLLLIAVGGSAEGANINKGNWEASGSFDFSHNFQADWDYNSYSNYGKNSLSLGGGAQYFLRDHFSVGLDASFFSAGRYTNGGSIGPVATYYFMTQERIAPYIQLSPLRVWKMEGTTNQNISLARVGTKFFFYDSVAFGPALQYQHTWPRTNYSSTGKDMLSILGLFSIHL